MYICISACTSQFGFSSPYIFPSLALGRTWLSTPRQKRKPAKIGSLMITCLPARNEVTQLTLTGEWTTPKINEVFCFTVEILYLAMQPMTTVCIIILLHQQAMELCLDACWKLAEITSSCLKEAASASVWYKITVKNIETPSWSYNCVILKYLFFFFHVVESFMRFRITGSLVFEITRLMKQVMRFKFWSENYLFEILQAHHEAIAHCLNIPPTFSPRLLWMMKLTRKGI